MSMEQSAKALFDRYEQKVNEALATDADMEAIADFYTDAFVAASPSGTMSGRNDAEFKKAMHDGFTRYREMGTQRMEVDGLRVTPIDDLHGLAYVDWRATYDVRGTRKVIEFTNVYLIRIEGAKTRVFGWIVGDENAELQKHGIT